MLVSLAIRDVVLIERLDVAFEPGLGVLTGETGAGKSILLDSLGLALGARSDSGLVRAGTAQLSVTAAFEVAATHPVRALLAEQGIAVAGEPVTLRRTVAADGRSRAFLNDQAVSVGLLRQAGDLLVEIHGQFESTGLLDQASHRGILDAYGALDGQRAVVRAAWRAWRAASATRAAAEAELAALDPKPGEEATLAERRTTLMHGEKLLEGMNAAFAALTRTPTIAASLQTARRALERVADKAEGRLAPVIGALERAADEAEEAATLLEKASHQIDLDPRALEAVEERLFALRAAARKHATPVDGLAALRRRLADQLAALDSGGDALAKLAAGERSARATYIETARTLGKARGQAGAGLDSAVAAELPPLKLDKASFRTRVEAGDEESWSDAGMDRVAFEVATNPGAAPGPLAKIASGGELARFMLALKVVLARLSPVPTIVFDEVDSGIGGAVAAAVGERLARLAREELQVLVVTHSPQVAARGASHWRVAKEHTAAGTVATRIDRLDGDARREEIARMLAGAHITDQARAAADSLLVGEPA